MKVVDKQYIKKIIEKGFFGYGEYDKVRRIVGYDSIVISKYPYDLSKNTLYYEEDTMYRIITGIWNGDSKYRNSKYDFNESEFFENNTRIKINF